MEELVVVLASALAGALWLATVGWQRAATLERVPRDLWPTVRHLADVLTGRG